MLVKFCKNEIGLPALFAGMGSKGRGWRLKPLPDGQGTNETKASVGIGKYPHNESPALQFLPEPFEHIRRL